MPAPLLPSAPSPLGETTFPPSLSYMSSCASSFKSTTYSQSATNSAARFETAAPAGFDFLAATSP